MGERRSRVLVVEDEWMIADQIVAALDAGGYDVVGPVGRVSTALALLKGGSVDAALLDINLHEDRSFRVAEQLGDSAVPFAFLSGYSGTELPPHLRDRPLMQKPLEAGALCACVESLLGRRH